MNEFHLSDMAQVHHPRRLFAVVPQRPHVFWQHAGFSRHYSYCDPASAPLVDLRSKRGSLVTPEATCNVDHFQAICISVRHRSKRTSMAHHRARSETALHSGIARNMKDIFNSLHMKRIVIVITFTFRFHHLSDGNSQLLRLYH